MKLNTKTKKVLFSIFMILDIALIIFLYCRGNTSNASTSVTTTTVTEEEVTTRTIVNTLTASGQISSALSESLSLSTSKYFKTMCVEEGDYVASGENIIQYSDGTYFTAPYNLVISSYSVPETGYKITSSNYVKVQSLEDLYMTLSVDETEIGSVKVGQTAEITVNANEGKKYTGTISKINEIGTYSSSGSSFTATIKITNDGNIKIGMSASCSVTLEEVTDALSVPVAAIQTKDNQKYVIVVNSDGTTKNVDVETGISNGSYVQIISGISAGEKIQMTSTTTQSTGKTSTSKTSQYSMGGMGSFTGTSSSMPSGMGRGSN